jgi:hypothetical protein
MMKSGETTTYEREQPPGRTTNDDLKSFMTKLAEKHDKFCDQCKTLLSEALN